MKAEKYISLDQEYIRRDFPDVFKRWEGTHMITAVIGTRIDLRLLKPNESVVYGDGKTFHFKLTKLNN